MPNANPDSIRSLSEEVQKGAVTGKGTRKKKKLLIGGTIDRGTLKKLNLSECPRRTAAALCRSRCASVLRG